MTNDDDQLGLYAPDAPDIIIDGCRLSCTCFACPEQYDVFDDKIGKKIGYLRLRHGVFRADAPKCGGKTVYVGFTTGDGRFEDFERMAFLAEAVEKLQEYEHKNTEESDD
jgi:hypothetical protein